MAVEEIGLISPKSDDVVVEIKYSGISTGTEKLFWTGDMPTFPGMGYPLVPGYESVGEVVEAGPLSNLKVGDKVFVPGANCFGEVKGLFGGAAKVLVTSAARLIKIDSQLKENGALFALAATARHAIAGLSNEMPDLIVGHGVLGRLLARLAIAAGGKPPTVWEVNGSRSSGASGYKVIRPEDDPRKDYSAIYDVSGDSSILDKLIGRITKGGEIVLAGFYPGELRFRFPAAFIKEARLRVSSEFTSDDITATRSLIESGSLSLEGLVTNIKPVSQAVLAYETAFNDPSCLKMVIDWSDAA
jgi:3-hydroxyethyl bacteriochlorophyllide a dehydrogenase